MTEEELDLYCESLYGHIYTWAEDNDRLGKDTPFISPEQLRLVVDYNLHMIDKVAKEREVEVHNAYELYFDEVRT